MAKIKVTQTVVNRGGKRYEAKNGVIEVSTEDLVHFEGFAKVEEKKVVTKTKKDENKN